MTSVTISVHRHSLRVIHRLYGTGPLTLDHASPLVPLLATRAVQRRVMLTESIDISGPPDLLASISHDAGYGLYRAHLQQLLDWITLHVAIGHQAWTAMMDYYRAMGLDIDDLDPGSVYRQWYRLQSVKKTAQGLLNTDIEVSKKTTTPPQALSAVISTTSELIERHPDAFYLRSGLPDPDMIRRAMIYAMSVQHGWLQIDIADRFGITQQAVSKSLNRFLRTRHPVLS